ncbi:MAG: FliA/WhiG family RNA polymerase sigma factor [Candidatus Caenarcaniphilales bacterium]|nr:FliA/WhiG family RNA polymerase sigma factor [Candidatus Caenarcaniphilales bacterium]
MKISKPSKKLFKAEHNGESCICNSLLDGEFFQGRQKDIENNIKLVQQIVNKFVYMKGRHLDEEDLVSYGTIGLIEAIDKYKASKGKNFAAFAAPRIKGAILDHLRVTDCLSRTSRKKVKALTNSINQLEAELGYTPSNLQIAEKMDISFEELNKIQREAAVSTFSLDINLTDDSEETWINQIADSRATPEQNCEKNNFKENLIKAIDSLPERERMVIGLYHYRNFTMKEIASTLNVSESRTCQIHNRAISILRSKLENYSYSD